MGTSPNELKEGMSSGSALGCRGTVTCLLAGRARYWSRRRYCNPHHDVKTAQGGILRSADTDPIHKCDDNGRNTEPNKERSPQWDDRVELVAIMVCNRTKFCST